MSVRRSTNGCCVSVVPPCPLGAGTQGFLRGAGVPAYGARSGEPVLEKKGKACRGLVLNSALKASV